MKEQFVPYEIALKLSEKGFDWHCLAVYMNGEFQIPRGFGMAIVTTEHVDILKGKAILAPLWQQVIDWFREKHFIDIMIRQTQKDGTAYYKITKIETEDKIKGYSNFCKTVDIARQAVIELALTLI